MAKQESEPFTLIDSDDPQSFFQDYKAFTSGKVTDIGNKNNSSNCQTADRNFEDVQIQASLRQRYPELNLTVTQAMNCPLLAFAYAGHATATLDTERDSILRWRGYAPPSHRGGAGALGDVVFYAKYHYQWAGEDFILYTIGPGYMSIQYILKEPSPASGEDTTSHCATTDALISAAVSFAEGDVNRFIYVFDQFWTRSAELWNEVQKASWEKVILAPRMKRELTSVANSFFDSKGVYERYGVPWRRGLIFHGPPGNGKTISIKALMHELYAREEVEGKRAVPTLYVKSAPSTYHIQQVFALARMFSPCLLVMEDVETIVTEQTRSYFFNEVDGLENNDGILMVASTNYLDRLDPGLSHRPSRFDRKYEFPMPDTHQRTLYAAFWQSKLAKSSPKTEFPDEMCGAIAEITDGFSFAYMQEAFVSALLELAKEELGGDVEELDGEEDVSAEAGGRVAVFGIFDGTDDPLDEYKLWRAIKRSVAILRKDLERSEGAAPARADFGGAAAVPMEAERERGHDSEQAPWPPGHLPDYDARFQAGGLAQGGRVPLQSSTGHMVDINGDRSLWLPAMVGSGHGRKSLPFGGKNEATWEQLAQQGVMKNQRLANSALEWR